MMEMNLKNFKLLVKLCETIKQYNLTENDIINLLEKLNESKNNIISQIEEDNKDESINEIDINLLSFHDNPVIIAKIGESNKIFVNDCENLTSSDGGLYKLKFFNRNIFFNLIESKNGIKEIILDIELNGNILYNVPFEIFECESESHSIELSKELLCKKQI